MRLFVRARNVVCYLEIFDGRVKTLEIIRPPGGDLETASKTWSLQAKCGDLASMHSSRRM